MTKAFLIDLSHCNGCYNCQIVCKDEHCGQSWLPYAEAQPDTGQFWSRIDERVRGQVPWVRVSYIPVICAHCAEAPCIAAAAAAGKPEAVYRREDGLVLIDPEAARNNAELAQKLVASCPLNAIYYNEELQLAQKCTGCAHLLDNGWTIPRCADACAHDAIQFKEEAEFGALLEKAEALPAVADLGPKVYYLHLPKRFVAGTAVDFADDEVIIGATVELVSGSGGAGGGFQASQETDELGDFKFDQVPPDVYTVVIRAEGYKPLEVTADLTEIDLSVGDLGLEKLG
ncbi:MAG: carboxypeptidase regulatory-like domain-containing protein [Coriobacteriales bacterium]|jgi:Fe-S-cluster-containing dehydrogenase component|nr:carboxypeptidase regulatory-like domain-containing protein [Coriobacteriales bacterium]